MKMNLITKLTFYAILCLCGVISAFAEAYETGQSVESFTAADQHGTAFTFKPAETRYLLVSHDMSTGKKANGVLNGLGGSYLPGKKAVYVANIHGMPGIGRFFAIPKMKRYAHQIILGDDAALIAKFPHQEGKVTVFTLSGGKVQSIAYWTPEAEALDTILK